MAQLSQSVAKEVRALHTAHGRKKSRRFLVEGYRAIRSMLQQNIRPEYLLVSRSLLTIPGGEYLSSLGKTDFLLIECDRSSFERLSDTEHSQGLLAVVDRSELPSAESVWDNARLLLYLDRISDPGNLGTIIRTAAAFGADLIAASPLCADHLAPKSLRASAGTAFITPFIRVDSEETFFAKLQSNQIALFGADVTSEQTLEEFRLDDIDRICLAIGSEAEGLSDGTRAACSALFRIPIRPQVESLNAAAAAAIALSQIARIRGLV